MALQFDIQEWNQQYNWWMQSQHKATMDMSEDSDRQTIRFIFHD